MQLDKIDLKSSFESIEVVLTSITSNLEINLREILKDQSRIDKISCRVKTCDSFVTKASKEVNGKLKYNEPFRELQDIIGARIVVFYKSDVTDIEQIIKDYYQAVEVNKFIPDDVTKFGYEGVHYVCLIPNFLFEKDQRNQLVPEFFELQIKTLYQHAWSQANHGLGYKPGLIVPDEEQRKLAFVAAQSWGADTILSEMAINRYNK